MGRRVTQAADLAELLNEPAPRQAPDRETLVQWMANRHAARAREIATAPVPFNAEDRLFTDLQHNMLGAEQHIRTRGLPLGQP